MTKTKLYLWIPTIFYVSLTFVLSKILITLLTHFNCQEYSLFIGFCSGVIVTHLILREEIAIGLRETQKIKKMVNEDEIIFTK